MVITVVFIPIAETPVAYVAQNVFCSGNVQAYCGFRRYSRDDVMPVCTGNWGCGAFGGDKQLKGKPCLCCLCPDSNTYMPLVL